MPQNFAHLAHISLCAFTTLICGKDNAGKFLLAGSGDNFSGEFGSGPLGKTSTFTPIPLPERFSNITQVVTGLDHSVFFGIDSNGKPLLAGSGHNGHAMMVWNGNALGTGENNHSRNICAHIEFPQNFVRVTEVVAGEGYTLLGGMDAQSKLVLAATGDNRYGQFGLGDNINRNILTLIPLPEYLEHQFQLLPENEGEQHDSGASEESIARPHF